MLAYSYLCRAMKNLVLLFALLMALACCTTETSREMDALLDRADSMNRAYIPMTDGIDSLLLEATRFYDRHGDANQQLRAHYLLGCAYRDMGEAPAALQSYQDAIDRADTLSSDCDYRRLMSVYGQMAELFHAQNLPHDELAQMEMYGYYALLIGDTLSYIRNLELYVKPYFLMGDTAAMLSSLQQAQHLYSLYGYHHEAAAIYAPIIAIYIGQDSIERAKELMDIFESRSGLFDSEGNINHGREGYYEQKGLYYLKTHQLDSAEVCFHRLLRVNDISKNAEAYKGLLALYKKKNNLDSVKKYVQLFEDALYKERADLRTHTVHQISSLYNYHRHLEKANAESRRTARIKSYLILSAFLIAVVILVAIIVFLHLAHKKKLKEKEAEAMRRDYANAIEKKEQIVKELELLKSNHNQLLKSEEAAKSALATVKAQNDQLITDKEKEIAELSNQIQELARRVLPANKLVGDDLQLTLLIDDFHRKASRKKNTAMPSRSEWGRLVHLFAQSQSAAYASIGRENVLSTQELRACILLLLDFTNSEVISLLDISDQRMTNIRASINYKLFQDTGASSLNKKLKEITIV